MADDKKKVRIQGVPNKFPDEMHGMKAAPPADPIKQVEPIQREKHREYKQAPPPDPPPEQDNSSD
ncbi:MAG: hypothetical protein ACLP5V_03815 [Candidatus Bathyarchaeia archaeon]